MSPEVRAMYLYMLSRRISLSIPARVTNCRHYDFVDQRDGKNWTAMFVRRYIPKRGKDATRG